MCDDDDDKEDDVTNFNMSDTPRGILLVFDMSFCGKIID